MFPMSPWIRRALILFISIMPNIVLFASKRDFNVGKTITQDTSINEYVNNLRLFGMRIPQEKVYVHLDNTCYFLGDTIWFAAYTHRTDKNAPSDLSRVLYAELWNQDGYLVERQLIKMEKGHGYGQFALPDTLYGGYYELRAYTRWQLNWGETEHPHTRYAEDWFLSPAMAREYYRDYDKLRQRGYADKYALDGRPVTKVGIAFSSTERNITDWQTE